MQPLKRRNTQQDTQAFRSFRTSFPQKLLIQFFQFQLLQFCSNSGKAKWFLCKEWAVLQEPYPLGANRNWWCFCLGWTGPSKVVSSQKISVRGRVQTKCLAYMRSWMSTQQHQRKIKIFQKSLHSFDTIFRHVMLPIYKQVRAQEIVWWTKTSSHTGAEEKNRCRDSDTRRV